MTGTLLADNSGEIGTGTESMNYFNSGVTFTWDEWFNYAMLIRSRSVFMTAKHVDGMTQWISPITRGRSIVNRDLFREFCDAARGRGLGVGVYFAVGDSWLFSQCGSTFNAGYVSVIKGQLSELLGGSYGLFDYIFLDAWGDTWGSGSAPDFTDIPLTTFNNHVRSLQPKCLIINNDHNDAYGDIRMYECPIDGEPKSGYTKPVALHRPIQTTNKWFGHSDSATEPLQPAARLAALSQHRMLLRGYNIIHNFSPGPDGLISNDIKLILNQLANTSVPSLWTGLESYWPLDGLSGNESDVAGVGMNTSITTLSAVNAPTSANGIKGGARVFNGSTQRFTCSTSNYTTHPLAHGNRTFSYAVWFYPTSFTPDFGVVIGKDDGSATTTEILLYLNGGVPTWRLCGNGVDYQDLASTGGAVSLNTWHLAVCSHDATADKQYLQIDGGTRDQSTWTAGIAESVSPFTVGCRGAGLLPYTGRVSKLMLFKDVALTAAQGAQLYNSGASLLPLDVTSTVDLYSDLVFHHKLDEAAGSTSALDATGNARTGTMAGTYTFGTAGKIGTGVSYGATDAKNTVANATPLGSTPISVFLWVKPTSLQDLCTYVVKALAISPFTGWYLRGTSGANTVEALVSVGGSFATPAVAGTMTTGSWQHIGFTYDGETLTTYRNGTAGTPNTAISGALDNTASSLAIGHDPIAAARTVDGVIDDVRIYNRCLSAAEVLALTITDTSPARNSVAGFNHDFGFGF